MKAFIKRCSCFVTLCLLMAVILIGGMCLRPDKVSAEETAITREKAIFLYYLSKFVIWPEERFSEKNQTITLCILGEDPFGTDLDLMIQTKKKHEDFKDNLAPLTRQLMIRRLVKSEKRNDCHLLFVSASERKIFSSILEELKGSRVLTVGDRVEFIQSGGMVHLALDQEKIHFEINLALVQESGLKISSKLLSLATLVTLEASNLK